MADQFDSKLGLDASDILNKLQAVSKAFADYTNSLNKNIAATAVFDTATVDIPQHLNNVVASANAASRAVTSFGTAAKNAAPGVAGFGFNVQSLVKIFATQQLLRGFGALEGAITGSIPAAVNFERQLAQIATISDKGDRSLDVLGDRVAFLSGELGKPAPEVAAGFYQALSNQVGNTSQTVQFFVESLKFSKAAVTDVSSAVDTLSGVLNAYGQTSAQTSHNSDILFRTIDLGRVTADELSNTIGRVLPLAAQLGVSFEEVSAALATLTVQGVKTTDAETQLLNLFVESLKPTEAFKQRLQELGFASSQLGIQTLGFKDFFLAISEGAESSDQLAKLFNNIRGLRGEVGLFSDGGKKLAATLADISDSAGASAQAFNTIQTTNAEKLTQELEKIKSVLVNDIGRGGLQVLQTLNEAFGGLSNTVLIVGGTITAVFGTLTTVVILGQVIPAITTLNAALAGVGLALGPIGLGLAVIGAAVGAFFLAFKAPDIAGKVSEEFAKIEKKTAETATRQAEIIRKQQDPVVSAYKATTQSLLQFEAQKQQAYTQSLKVAIESDSAQSENLRHQIGARLQLIDQFTRKVDQLQNDQGQRAKALAQDQLNVEFAINQKQFDRRLGNAPQGNQANLLSQRFQQLLSASQDAFNKGNVEFSKQILTDAGGIASKHADITGNISLENRFLAASKVLHDNILKVQNQEIEAAKQLEAANAPITESLRTALLEARELTTERDKLLKKQAGGEDVTAKLGAVEKQITETLGLAEQLGARLNGATTKGGAKLNIVQDVQDLIRQIQNQPIPLSLQAKKAFDDLRTSAEAEFNQKPISVGVKFNFGGFGTDAKSIAELQKQIEFAAQRAQAVPGARGAVRDQVSRASALLEGFADQAKRSQSVSGPFGLSQEEAAAADANIKNFVANANKTLSGLQFDSEGNLLKSSQVELDALTGKIKGAISDFQNAKGFDFGFSANGAATLQSVLDTIQRLIQEEKTLKQLENDAASGEAAQQKLNDLQLQNQKIQEQQSAVSGNTQAFNTLGTALEQDAQLTATFNAELAVLGPTAQSSAGEAIGGLSGIGAAAESQIGGVFALVSALEQLAQAESAVGSNRFASRGGFQAFFANGGVARGSDRIPAMLSPGETVINAKSSRAFFSELMSINSGVQPTFRNHGGQVGDTFGDINISITGVNGNQIDTGKLSKALQRAVRTGTARKTR